MFQHPGTLEWRVSEGARGEPPPLLSTLLTNHRDARVSGLTSQYVRCLTQVPSCISPCCRNGHPDGRVWGGGSHAHSAKPSRLQHEVQNGGLGGCLFAKVQPTLSSFILRTCTTTSCHAYGGGGAASPVSPSHTTGKRPHENEPSSRRLLTLTGGGHADAACCADSKQASADRRQAAAHATHAPASWWCH